MLCPNCATENVADAKFCGNCGTPLNAAAPEPEASVAPEAPAAPEAPQLLPHLPRRFRRPHPQRPPHRFLLQRQLRQSPSSLRSHRSNMLPLSNPPRRNRPTPLPRSSRTAHRSRLTAFPCLRKHTLWREAIRRFASSRSS
ncbi:zinc ribbon domain-containing protein [Senegalimassilia anaerobia]